MSKKRVFYKLDLGPATATVFSTSFGAAVRTAAKNLRREQLALGWNPKKLFQLVTDRDTRGFKGVHGGPVNEHVGRLGETNTVQEILKRAGVKIRRSNFRNWAA